MINFKKQKDKWNQILRERKYRPSIFGMSVHFDWRFLVGLFFVLLILILFFGLRSQSKIDDLYERDFSSEVQIEKLDKINIEKFDKILRQVEQD